MRMSYVLRKRTLVQYLDYGTVLKRRSAHTFFTSRRKSKLTELAGWNVKFGLHKASGPNFIALLTGKQMFVLTIAEIFA